MEHEFAGIYPERIKKAATDILKYLNGLPCADAQLALRAALQETTRVSVVTFGEEEK